MPDRSATRPTRRAGGRAARPDFQRDRLPSRAPIGPRPLGPRPCRCGAHPCAHRALILTSSQLIRDRVALSRRTQCASASPSRSRFPASPRGRTTPRRRSSSSRRGGRPRSKSSIFVRNYMTGSRESNELLLMLYGWWRGWRWARQHQVKIKSRPIGQPHVWCWWCWWWDSPRSVAVVHRRICSRVSVMHCNGKW